MNFKLVLIISILVFTNCERRIKSTQNPSPMAEHIRPHERVDDFRCEGISLKLDSIFDTPVNIFIPPHLADHDTINLVFHFHGNPKIINWAACSQQRKLVVATINLGTGSSKYEQPLLNPNIINDLLNRSIQVIQSHKLTIDQTIISGFSAGYGAVRAILSNPSIVSKIDGVLLLDGLHTDYVPKGMLLSNGGKLNTTKLLPFVQFAQSAANGEKRFIFTHSSIFPGTYASTTECADYLINEIGLNRTPVLKKGPLGMQQVGHTEKGGLKILAFAGNTAPDHIDHLHGFYAFIDLLYHDFETDN